MRLSVLLGVIALLVACAAGEQQAASGAAPVALSQEDLIRNAESAGPASIAAEATIRDWEMNVVRQGSNGWTCLPDRADTEGNDPWCVNEPWLQFLEAYVNRTEPQYSEMGFAYMFQGDSPVSNTDPFATGPTPDNQWISSMGAHMMILVPDRSVLDSMTSDHANGGPWVMWPNTPYAHIMVPVDSH